MFCVYVTFSFMSPLCFRPGESQDSIEIGGNVCLFKVASGLLVTFMKWVNSHAILCPLLRPRENIPILISDSVHHRCFWEDEHLGTERGHICHLPWALGASMELPRSGAEGPRWGQALISLYFSHGDCVCCCSGLPPGVGKAWLEGGNVNLPFPPFSVNPFLFLCFIRVL